MTLAQGIERRLSETRGPVFYADIAEHLLRDALFIVSPELDLLQCGVAVAMDDADSVGDWIKRGTLRKPTEAERGAWKEEKLARWDAIVVQPFVLVRLLPDA